MRAYAPTIAQGEGRSHGEWRIGVFSLRPLTIHQERQKTIIQYKLIVNRIYSSNLLEAPRYRTCDLVASKTPFSEKMTFKRILCLYNMKCFLKKSWKSSLTVFAVSLTCSYTYRLFLVLLAV